MCYNAVRGSAPFYLSELLHLYSPSRSLHWLFVTYSLPPPPPPPSKQSNTKGSDGLDGKILRLSAPFIAETLTYIYNLCIDKNTFPQSI